VPAAPGAGSALADEAGGKKSVKRMRGSCSSQRGDSLCGQCGNLEAPGARPGT
jgi:hypothetical protein